VSVIRDRQRFPYLFVHFIVTGLAVIIYSDGLSGTFLFDDYENLAALNSNGGVTSYKNFMSFVFGNDSGVLGRPLSMLSFLINDEAFPGDPSSYLYTNLMLHCLCGQLIFLFIYKLFVGMGHELNVAAKIAMLVSAWWLLSPINVSTTLYIIQRMTQLSSMFLLCGLIFYLNGRDELVNGKKGGLVNVFVGLYFFGGLSLLCKENGALIFVYAAACECGLCFQARKAPNKTVLALIAIPILILCLYFWGTWSQRISPYQNRDFDLYERLMSELRILVVYIKMIVYPAAGGMGLFHDDFQISKSFFQPVSTFLSLIFHVVIIVGAVLFRNRQPMLVFACIWFYGGHLLESTFLPLELFFEHRNYLPSVGVILLFVTLACLSRFSTLLSSLLVLLIITSAIITKQRAEIWGRPEWRSAVWAEEHPGSIRAQDMYVGHLLAAKEYEKAILHLNLMKKKWPNAFHLDLFSVLQQCSGNFETQTDIGALMLNPEESEYYGTMLPLLESLVDLHLHGECEGLGAADMHRILLGVNKMKFVSGTVRARANFMDAKLYVKEGGLNGAMAAMERSFKANNNPLVLHAQAELLGSAGLWGEALEYVEKAIELESGKRMFRRGNLKFYMKSRERIIQRMNSGR